MDAIWAPDPYDRGTPFLSLQIVDESCGLPNATHLDQESLTQPKTHRIVASLVEIIKTEKARVGK